MKQCVGKAVRTAAKRELAAKKTHVSCHEGGKFNMEGPHYGLAGISDCQWSLWVVTCIEEIARIVDDSD